MNEQNVNGSSNSFLYRLLSANAEFLTAPGRFPLLIFLLLLVLLLTKSGLFSGIGGDDGEQLIFAQYFDWGYVVRNPPLYTWFVILSQHVFGVSALAVNMVKLVTLFFLYWFMYKAGMLLLKEHRLAVLAALSPLLIFHIAWDSLLGFSHSVLVATLYAATFFAVFNLEKNQRFIAYIGLGIAIGCGILSKYAYVFFLAALFAACLFDPILRKRILNPKILISLGVAALIASPHLLWLYDRHTAMAGELAPALQAQGSAEHLIAAGKGILSGIKAIIGFLLPFLIFVALVFPAAWRIKLSTPETEMQRHHRTISIFFVLLIGIILSFIVVGGVSRVRTHYMYVMILVPLYFFLRVKIASISEKRLNVYAGLLSTAAIVVLLGLPIKFFAEPYRCGKCEHHMPYKILANQIQKDGFQSGTIFAYWHPYPIAGNMRIAFPKARVISAKHPTAVPPLKGSAQCLLVWSGPAQGSQASNTIRLAQQHLNITADNLTKAKSVQAILATGTKKKFELGYVLINPGHGDCR